MCTNNLKGIANGIFFNLGARLARYTGNDTYAKVAEQTYDWLDKIGFIDPDTYAIYDGAHVETNCTDINKSEFSYNMAAVSQGVAFMYDYTKSDSATSAIWEARLRKFIAHGLAHFFPDDIAYEPNCEPFNTCTADMYTFKGYMHRWWSMMQQLAPFTADLVQATLEKSAQAAINQCTGGAEARQCGFKWSSGSYDGKTGAGQEMSVLGATIGLLLKDAKGPVTSKTGGTSKGNVNAGNNNDDNDFTTSYKPITTTDRAGAGILTFLVLAGVTGMFGWMSYDK